jgi:D-alanyl-D-alanine carboxypeptidase
VEERGDTAVTGDARLRDAVAAWVASADEKPGSATREAAGTDGPDETGAGGDAAPEERDGADAESDVEAGAGARATTAGEGKSEAGTHGEGDAGTEGVAAARAGQGGAQAVARDQDGAGTDDGARADGDGEPVERAHRADDDATAAAATAGPEPAGRGDDAKAAGVTGTGDETDERAGVTDAGVGDSSDGDPADASAAPAAKDAGAKDAGAKDAVSAKPPVDQPTAVFRAVRPGKPEVDQPTAMLKLGDVAKAPEEKDDGEPQAESEAERTSKFVALKPLDDPSTRKPPAADATTALPRVPQAPAPQAGPERTTQQPLPPKPPLDLLAELTNTPPPPETPVRTLVRRVKIWTPLVLLLAIVIAVVQAVRPLPTPELRLTGEDSYTFEGGKVDIPWPTAPQGQAALDVQGIGTFGSSGEQKPVPIASVAKVMTAYVILRDHPLKSGADGPKIKIDQAAADQSHAGQESTVVVTAGDSITQREALESILIASANNVARLLARWDAGSEKSFVKKMNDAAADLGMKNTTYTDPSGLNNTTVSTAVDQVKLAKKAMEQPAFREVAAMMQYIDYKGRKHDNWNRLVGSNNVVGIKTGTTTSALGNLVFAAKKDVDGETHRIVGAVVRQPAGGPDNTIIGAALYEGDRLIRAAQDALKSATILKKGDVVGYVDDGLGGRTPVVATQDVTAVGWAGLTVKLTFAAAELPHTAKAGTKVGSLTVGDGSGSAVKVPVALQKDLVEPGFADKLTRLG